MLLSTAAHSQSFQCNSNSFANRNISSSVQDMIGMQLGDHTATMTSCAATRHFMHSPHAPITPTYRKRVVGELQIASIFSEPSAFLQKVLRDKELSSVDEFAISNKRQRMIDSTLKPFVHERRVESLHEACCKADSSVETVQRLFQVDPSAISRPLRVALAQDPLKIHEKVASEDEMYSYPINLAIHHQADPSVLAYLIHAAAPDVLAQPDGPNEETSLHVIIKHSPQDTQTALLMLLSQPSMASATDCHGNTPLHLAYLYAASAETIQYLSLVFPQALDKRNHQNQVPLDLAAAATQS
jgi:hypothetical protein